MGTALRVKAVLAGAAVAALLAALATAVADSEGAEAAGRFETVTKTFTNPTSVGIPDAGTATPYPSQIEIGGLRRGKVLDVNVRLNSATHTWPDDLDLLLVGPASQDAIVMADAGWTLDLRDNTFSLDDEADKRVPDSSRIGNRTYRPANYSPSDSFPSPAPSASGNTALAAFDGTNPNGTWSLYVVDDEGGDAGSMAGGWSLTIKAKVRR